MHMKTQLHINQFESTNNIASSTPGYSRPLRGKFRCTTALLAITGVLLADRLAQANDDDKHGNKTQVGDIFVIALENHNFTQLNLASSPQQILGNPAAPFINSLITPVNTN